MSIVIIDPLYTAGVQKAINEKAGQKLTPDGIFGNQSVAALRTCQAKIGVPVTGVYDEATKAILDPFILAKYLTMDAIKTAATALNVTPAHIRTVCDVESKGSGFLPDGRPQILFERHKFLECLKTRLPADQVAKLQVQNPDIINATPGGYSGGAGEYLRFNRAAAIDRHSAIYGTSWGLFQIMGFNADICGYTDLDVYVKDMQTSELKQLLAFVAFNKKYRSGVLAAALAMQKWDTYALNYNGGDYRKNQYDTKLAASFAKFSKNIFA